MLEPEKTIDAGQFSIFVIAYDEKARSLLAASLTSFGVQASQCATFREAENLALAVQFRGIVVDLATMVKAKGEEKIIAHAMTEIYPALRVKTIGPMIVPMAMAGDAKQDKTLKDFLAKRCAEFSPRRLRAYKRKDICIPTMIGSDRGYTLNISWGGVFIVDMNPERFSIGDELVIHFPDFEQRIEVVVARVQIWGQQRPPGIGVRFKSPGQKFEEDLFSILNCDRDHSRDRFI